MDAGLNSTFSDKFKALGWGTQNTTKVGDPVKTKGGNGYVQYYDYNGGKRAIYYSASGTFGLEPDLVEKYNALGQETFNNGALGYPSSDAKSCGSGCVYAEFEKGIIIKSPRVNQAVTVYGDIYKKYAFLNRWSGVLEFPTTDELDLTSKRGRYNVFEKGQIFWSSATGAQAFWSKVASLYGNTGYDTGWLGLPITSVTPNAAIPQAAFENGSIVVQSTCAGYYNKQNQQVLVSGTPSSRCY